MGLLSRWFASSAPARLIGERSRWLKIPSLSPALRQLLQGPLPDGNTPVAGAPWLAFDFETSGLDARRDRILSIGCVGAEYGEIILNGASHHYVREAASINAHSAVINHITPEMLQGGGVIDDLMESLFTRLQGRIAVVHGKMVESAFIDAWLQERYGLSGLPIPWIDTLDVERQHRRAIHCENADLRLSAIRRYYGLPDYPAHHALCDAVATAELLLAQVRNQSRERPLSLQGLIYGQK